MWTLYEQLVIPSPMSICNAVYGRFLTPLYRTLLKKLIGCVKYDWAANGRSLRFNGVSYINSLQLNLQNSTFIDRGLFKLHRYTTEHNHFKTSFAPDLMVHVYTQP